MSSNLRFESDIAPDTERKAYLIPSNRARSYQRGREDEEVYMLKNPILALEPLKLRDIQILLNGTHTGPKTHGWQ